MATVITLDYYIFIGLSRVHKIIVSHFIFSIRSELTESLPQNFSLAWRGQVSAGSGVLFVWTSIIQLRRTVQLDLTLKRDTCMSPKVSFSFSPL